MPRRVISSGAFFDVLELSGLWSKERYTSVAPSRLAYIKRSSHVHTKLKLLFTI